MNVRVMSSILKENVPGSENPDDMNLLQVCDNSLVGAIGLVLSKLILKCVVSFRVTSGFRLPNGIQQWVSISGFAQLSPVTFPFPWYLDSQERTIQLAMQV